ncbi:alpha/beta fold hydrolase [Hymenobacter ruricola]|uniref:Alpha/beta hydrolase n=1 Tax=Hymenobacter ruricola TaxID=2791023 RepID=A0ABS0I319_9BACT|nr:alpha/beta fold hydrolase [Hymenobacter ruricola]MBF9221341.1 alpha/beta hydrolase [Hymenobacter ruricola]
MQTTQFELVDSSRQRVIPVAAYYAAAETGASTPTRKLALLNHGYGGKNTDYTFIAQNLVAHGYYVASLQQDLPGDAPMPTATGNVYQARYPYWARGVQTMLFALKALKRRQPGLDLRHVLVVGHSNGGDMAMLLAQQHPELVQKVISLDNRRVPFPRQRRPEILSLRSSDQVADPGVLPSPAEQAKYHTTIIQLPATLHNDMWDGATEAQKREINYLISRFLQ